jgi:transposase-like protein
VALELVSGGATLSQVSSRHEVHPNQAGQWRRHLVENAAQVFEDRAPAEAVREKDGLIEDLYAQIGRLTVERDWLKKKIGGR